MKVSAYAPTAAWVAGVFNIIPTQSILLAISILVLALYSLYLLHTGIARANETAGRQGPDLHDGRRGLGGR